MCAVVRDGFSKIMFLRNIFCTCDALFAKTIRKNQTKPKQTNKNPSWQKGSESVRTHFQRALLMFSSHFFFVSRNVRTLARPGLALATKGCTSHVKELDNAPAFSEQEEVKI